MHHQVDRREEHQGQNHHHRHRPHRGGDHLDHRVIPYPQAAAAAVRILQALGQEHNRDGRNKGAQSRAGHQNPVEQSEQRPRADADRRRQQRTAAVCNKAAEQGGGKPHDTAQREIALTAHVDEGHAQGDNQRRRTLCKNIDQIGPRPEAAREQAKHGDQDRKGKQRAPHIKELCQRHAGPVRSLFIHAPVPPSSGIRSPPGWPDRTPAAIRPVH